MPKPSDTTTPRRLLREVVFDQMREAILDGTLQPGERLNDDDLVAWLGVSRTPVREAIAKLHAAGLVEVEANKYTRVASLSDDDYREASQLLAGYHQLAQQWGVPALSEKDRKGLLAQLEQIHARLQVHELDAAKDLLDTQGALVRASGNNLFARTEEPLRTRVKFLTPRDAAAVDFTAAAEQAAALVTALSQQEVPRTVASCAPFPASQPVQRAQSSSCDGPNRTAPRCSARTEFGATASTA